MRILFEGLCGFLKTSNSWVEVWLPQGSHTAHAARLVIAARDVMHVGSDGKADSGTTWMPDEVIAVPNAGYFHFWDLEGKTVKFGDDTDVSWQEDPLMINLDALHNPDPENRSAHTTRKQSLPVGVLVLSGGFLATAGYDIREFQLGSVNKKKIGSLTHFASKVEWVGFTGGTFLNLDTGKRIVVQPSASMTITNASPDPNTPDHFMCYYDVISGVSPNDQVMLDYKTGGFRMVDIIEGTNCIPPTMLPPIETMMTSRERRKGATAAAPIVGHASPHDGHDHKQ